MQAVLLAAGKSSRFYPYNYFSHKSLIKILGKPIIVHTIESIKKSGIKDIILIISKDSEIKKILGSGKNLGVNIQYVVQKEPTGGGNGLLLAEKSIGGDFFLLNVSRVDFWEFKELMLSKKSKNDKAILLAKKEKNLEKYGFLKVEKDKVLDLIEKPQKGKEPSNLRLIGIYLFTKDFLKTLRQTLDEHYRLEKAISSFSKIHPVKFVETEKEAPSLKYSFDLLGIKNYLLKNIKKSIGKNAVIGNNVILRNGVDVEENCVIGANMEIKNSLIMKGTKVHSGFIGDSIIGENCRIGADFSTANVRLDRKPVGVVIKEREIDSGLNHLGTLVGRNTKIGIKASTMPGTVIGQNAIVGTSTVVLNNVVEDTKYFTKFKEIVVKK